MSDHYERLAAQEVEPIIIMEAISRRQNIPEVPRMNIVLAEKHILRAGEKDDNPWDKEIYKAEDYLHRARTGKWMTDSIREIEKLRKRIEFLENENLFLRLSQP